MTDTKQCEGIQILIGKTLVTVVDTPGFDGGDGMSDGANLGKYRTPRATFTADCETKAKISEFLTAQYKVGITLRGILYLHNITTGRMDGGAVRSLETFRNMINEEAMANIALVETHWDKQSPYLSEGLLWDQELRSTFWQDLVAGGADVFQYSNSPEEARTIVGRLLKKDKRIVLRIQHEVVDESKKIEETLAGLKVRSKLDREMDLLMKDHERLQADLKNAKKRKDVKVYNEIKMEMKDRLEIWNRTRLDREELQRRINEELTSKIASLEKQIQKDGKNKWLTRVQKFAAILGPVVHIALTFAGTIPT